ncbi:MAG: DUF4062 domain-containing protein [Mesorhizobium sp.]|nr:MULTISPECIES: DUF4062 domain-containing protein [unclassified Mesorhizobium]RUV66765.1 DUF4062 domain-containing protein [Mesorhizobium sp. M5C.F.Cr.IN.023.01.1.1]RWF89891.1 MAG: DUF4062 domain-containing protein [Mesorhizobium sp.]RWF96037.1 MAG: DUF4062 domain-containing protein [Mesorhizobium sp.]RWI41032.1 MAG: DUF4062 domain-containing protein [Mesorhizobium sp.]RWI46614.1 MAG: DUF4062 domain-containing protein [Mesorhizobium sp.]
MDVKYQIFVSSTYADLVDERRSVIEAVLNLGHIPVGMEARRRGREGSHQVVARTAGFEKGHEGQQMALCARCRRPIQTAGPNPSRPFAA